MFNGEVRFTSLKQPPPLVISTSMLGGRIMQTLPAPYRTLVGRPVELTEPSRLFASIGDVKRKEMEMPSTPISDQVLVTVLMGLCWSIPLSTLVFLWLK